MTKLLAHLKAEQIHEGICGRIPLKEGVQACQGGKMQRRNLVFISFALVLLPHQSIQV